MVGIELSATVSEKGQVVIPKPIRDLFNLQPDTEVLFGVEEEKIVLKKKHEALAIFDEFVNAVKKKKRFPEKVSWDKEYYSQFD